MRHPGEIDWHFKKALATAGWSQRQLGRRVKINHTLLSMYVRGRYILNAAERKKIARALRRPESEIFCD